MMSLGKVPEIDDNETLARAVVSGGEAKESRKGDVPASVFSHLGHFKISVDRISRMIFFRSCGTWQSGSCRAGFQPDFLRVGVARSAGRLGIWMSVQVGTGGCQLLARPYPDAEGCGT